MGSPFQYSFTYVVRGIVLVVGGRKATALLPSRQKEIRLFVNFVAVCNEISDKHLTYYWIPQMFCITTNKVVTLKTN